MVNRYGLALLLAAAVAAGPSGQFRSGVETVRVDVHVSDRGRPVTDLTLADFEVRDSNVLQTLDSVSFEQVPLNVVLVFDTSGSLEEERVARLGSAADALLRGLHENDQAALITFSHVVEERVSLTHDLETLRQGLAALRGGGQTALADAIHAGILTAQADADRPIVVVLSDGVDTMSWLTQDAVLDTARRSEAAVYSVYTGGPRAPSLLRELASATGGSVFENVSSDRLRDTFARIAGEFRQRYLITYSPRDVPAGGWHPIDVRVKGRRHTIKARPGYEAGPSRAAKDERAHGSPRSRGHASYPHTTLRHRDIRPPTSR
jgi:Ca-activated chloride channel family protein